MESISNRFQVEELEQRLEMAQWTAKATGKMETTQTGGNLSEKFTTEISVGVTWGK